MRSVIRGLILCLLTVLLLPAGSTERGASASKPTLVASAVPVQAAADPGRAGNADDTWDDGPLPASGVQDLQEVPATSAVPAARRAGLSSISTHLFLRYQAFRL